MITYTLINDISNNSIFASENSSQSFLLLNKVACMVSLPQIAY